MSPFLYKMDFELQKPPSWVCSQCKWASHNFICHNYLFLSANQI